ISSASADAINESIAAGEVIYTALADDSADASNGFTFSLSGAGASNFSISNDEATFGQVVLNNQLVAGQYSFEVIATDAAGNVSAAQPVTLNINDLDDTAPIVSPNDTADAIDENSGAGQVVYTASADDSADVSDGVTFSLAGADAGAFEIDAVTGAVTLKDNPNYEEQAQYSFDVIATDVAGNASAPQSVTLDINNLDELAPVVSASDVKSLSSYSGAGQVIYTPDVVDDSNDKTSVPLTY
ncbi:MAG: cadherin repeat domain-containing protein, partial [Porticoccaceae bacterium]